MPHQTPRQRKIMGRVMHEFEHGEFNAVSLYAEHEAETFHSVHVESARRVAAQARQVGVERLAHISDAIACPP